MDTAVLEFIGRHRLVLASALRHTFFRGMRDAERHYGNLVRKLKEGGLVHTFEREVHPYSLYALTAKGANQAGLPKSMAAPMSEGKPQVRDLARQLSVLWFCCMGTTRRAVVLPKVVESLFNKKSTAHQVVHIAEYSESSMPVLLRAYVVGESTPVTSALDTLRGQCDKIRGEQLEGLARAGKYAVQALCHTPEKAEELSALLDDTTPWVRISTGVGLNNLTLAHQELQARAAGEGVES